MKPYYLKIADLYVKILVEARGIFEVLPDNYSPFLADSDYMVDCLSEILITDEPICFDSKKAVARFNDLGFVQEVFKGRNDGYVFRVFDTSNRLVATMKVDDRFKCNRINFAMCDERSLQFGFDNMMMIAFAFSSAYFGCLMMHSSVVLKDGWGYLFLGRSGTGKSTHSSLWLKNIKGASLLNDDNPAVRVVDGSVFVFGTPWSGKTPCYKQQKAKAGAFVMLQQKPYNKIIRQNVLLGLSSLMSSCSIMIWDKMSYNKLIDSMSLILSLVPVYTLECLPDNDAAKLSYNSIKRI